MKTKKILPLLLAGSFGCINAVQPAAPECIHVGNEIFLYDDEDPYDGKLEDSFDVTIDLIGKKKYPHEEKGTFFRNGKEQCYRKYYVEIKENHYSSPREMTSYLITEHCIPLPKLEKSFGKYSCTFEDTGYFRSVRLASNKDGLISQICKNERVTHIGIFFSGDEECLDVYPEMYLTDLIDKDLNTTKAPRTMSSYGKLFDYK